VSSNIKIVSILLIIINDFYLVTATHLISQILRLSKSAQGKTAAGQVVNLLYNDVNRSDSVTLSLHFVWITPIQTTVITYFIWEAVGWSALIGVFAIFLQTVPVQSKFFRITFQSTP
jgi:ATP-binding cassette subfamily C (CFTR/MRP) protein 4